MVSLHPDSGVAAQNVAKLDVVVIGGGPAGATAAHDLARRGHAVALLDRAGRTKPCGGAVPPCLVRDFDIPFRLMVATATSARMVSPSDRRLEMPIEGGYVGMVNRDEFDEWLRTRAAKAGALRCTGTFERITRDDEGTLVVHFKHADADKRNVTAVVRARAAIGADGAPSRVARQEIPGAVREPFVYAYHEIVRSPEHAARDVFDSARCDIYLGDTFSPDFYGWVFPHGPVTSVGAGSVNKGFSLRTAVTRLRSASGLDTVETVRREGAPIPFRTLKQWDNGRDVVLAGDAAGCASPASGEGIYYAMLSGRLAADAVDRLIVTGNTCELRSAQRRFMEQHGNTFRFLGLMQRFCYANDRRRERFIGMCRDADFQKLAWAAYVHKQLAERRRLVYLRAFLKAYGTSS